MQQGSVTYELLWHLFFLQVAKTEKKAAIGPARATQEPGSLARSAPPPPLPPQPSRGEAGFTRSSPTPALESQVRVGGKEIGWGLRAKMTNKQASHAYMHVFDGDGCRCASSPPPSPGGRRGFLCRLAHFVRPPTTRPRLRRTPPTSELLWHLFFSQVAKTEMKAAIGPARATQEPGSLAQSAPPPPLQLGTTRPAGSSYTRSAAPTRVVTLV